MQHLSQPLRETLHARLRRETSPLHAEVERALPLLSPGLTLERYREVLQRFHGFYAPHEVQMVQFASQVPFPLRCRTQLLVQDLLALGTSVPAVERLHQCVPPPMSRIAQLAGRLYVFEGASLGGQVAAQALRKNLGFDAGSGAAFFVGDGADTVPRWRQVLRWIEDFSASRAEADLVAASAHETFSSLRDWLAASHG